MTPAPRRKRMPKLPAEVFSVLGPIPVTEVDEQEEFGLSHFDERRITLLSRIEHRTKWQTLCHEIAHMAMWDGAAQQQLTDEQKELVCDVMGTYLAAAVQAGYMKITVPKEK